MVGILEGGAGRGFPFALRFALFCGNSMMARLMPIERGDPTQPRYLEERRCRPDCRDNMRNCFRR